MNPPPIVVGLLLCKYVHFEEGVSRNASLVGCFNRLVVNEFLATPPFFVYVVLTSGVGDVMVRIGIERLDTGEEIYAHEDRVHFPDKVSTGQLSFPIMRCAFPTAGWYQVVL
jgi:hypothetical protein